MTSTIADPDRVPIGLDRNRDWVEVKFTGVENPHILIVGGSQVGKTTLQILIAAVTASRGNIVIILDPKLRFDRPFRRRRTHEPLPHVRVYGHEDPDTAAREWEGILRILAAERQRRYQLDRQSDVGILGDHERFPTILVVIDELGNLLDMADKEWNKRKPDKYKGDTPIRELLHDMTRMGAEARIIECFANQTSSERELPAGTRTRNLCGHRIFLGSVREGPHWRMLAGEGVRPPDIPAGQKGAGAIIYSDGAPWRFQAGFIDWDKHPEQVYDLAAQGIPLLREQGHIDEHGNLLLGGVPVPRPGQIASLVAGADWNLPLPTAERTTDDANEPPLDVPPPRMIAGLAAAAEFCGLSISNFRRLKDLYEIPGEVKNYQSNKPAWPEPDLREWSLQHRTNRRKKNTENDEAEGA